MKVSDCDVTDYGFHVQRILTRIDRKAEKHIVTLNGKKGEITFVEGGHDVERITAVSYTAPVAAVTYAVPALVTCTAPAPTGEPDLSITSWLAPDPEMDRSLSSNVCFQRARHRDSQGPIPVQVLPEEHP